MFRLLFLKKGKLDLSSLLSVWKELQFPELASPSEELFSFGHTKIEFLKEIPFTKEELVSFRKGLAPYEIDLLQIENGLSSKEPSLFFFDMDSTVIQEEVIDELARKHGVFEEVASVTKQAMNGGLGFDEALRLRVKHLNGLSRKSFGEVYDVLHLNPGMEVLFSELPKQGTKIVILSGGFTPVLDLFAKKYPVSFYKANHLEEKDGIFTGEITGEIINKEKKEHYLRSYSEENSVPISGVVAVGDGANDSLMLNAAGTGIGFHAKQGLKDQIMNWIDFSDMSVLLFLFRPTV
ncbi:phosphoserine phosphatase SerB [Leptospira idonii]|uniref:Phosphoserine phosphatase n=1 Tax=Leptospira idonii TaxID=1193500 RepID=A0A4R9M1V2_9LEPT|nr:phosphoserine phosphatase SerB [Leptospira idonii]TGN20713.1 phosphoserine phosphatase SerB [Leptospira idonii]